MTVIVKPLTKRGRLIERMPSTHIKAARSCVGKMPTLFMAFREGDLEGDIAVLGFRYRRQSHSCELTWWIGEDEELLEGALSAIRGQMFLEGRRRLEANVEESWRESNETAPDYRHPHERGGQKFAEFLKTQGFIEEGRMKYFTKFFEDVVELSWTILDKSPVFNNHDMVVTLGENETTRKYHGKNIELYEKNLEYYQPVEGEKTLKELLESNVEFVRTDERFVVVENWDEKESTDD